MRGKAFRTSHRRVCLEKLHLGAFAVFPRAYLLRAADFLVDLRFLGLAFSLESEALNRTLSKARISSLRVGRVRFTSACTREDGTPKTSPVSSAVENLDSMTALILSVFHSTSPWIEFPVKQRKTHHYFRH